VNFILGSGKGLAVPIAAHKHSQRFSETAEYPAVKWLKEFFMWKRVQDWRLVFWLGALVLFGQITQLSYFISQAADTRPVIAALSSDASNAIDVAGRSQWWRDNGFAGYGPVYFRLANTLAFAFTPLTDPGEWTPAEGRTKAYHFSLLAVSAASVVLLSLFLGALAVGRRSNFFPWASALWLWALLQAGSWQKFLLVAHPDHLLALCVAVAGTLSFRFWNTPNDERLRKWVAWGWGLCLAIKFSAILFFPAVVLGQVWFSKSRLKTFAEFAGHSFLAYALIGFPQNLNIPRTLRFLTYQSHYSSSATSASVMEWLGFFQEQTWLTGLIVLSFVGLMLSQGGFRKPKTQPLLFALILVLLPTLSMLGQSISAPHDHYPMPVVACALALVLSAVRPVNFALRFSVQLESAVAVLLAVGLAWMGSLPSGLNTTLRDQLRCRIEAKVTYKKIQELLGAGALVFADPYVPSMDKTPNFRSIWTPTKKFIADGGFTAIVVNPDHEKGYFGDPANEAYIKVYNPEMQATKEYFSLFRQGPLSFSDPEIGKWRRTFKEENCGWEIWQRE
jgi:hypothetical protein